MSYEEMVKLLPKWFAPNYQGASYNPLMERIEYESGYPGPNDMREIQARAIEGGFIAVITVLYRRPDRPAWVTIQFHKYLPFDES